LWIVVLVPSALRRRAERQGAGSIDHFHHQLELLEHAGPKLVAPAYRLHTALPGGGACSPHEVVSSRPKLVLLRPVDDEQSADIDDIGGAHYERVGVLETPEPAVNPAETRAGLQAYRRQQARQRCSMLLRCLTGVTLSTGLIGMFPSLHLAWIFTGLTGLGALALVGLMAYAKEMETQRSWRRPAPYREGRGDRYDDTYYDDAPAISAAGAGYPGAWDEEYAAAPRQAAAH
jgi:hypothetical protein